MSPHPAWLGAAAALLAFILPATPARAEVTVKTVSCMNLPNCLSLSNAHVEVIVTTDIGPRVIGYRRLTGRNVLAEMPGKVGSSEAQQQWMRKRVLFQGVALLLVALILIVAGASGS